MHRDKKDRTGLKAARTSVTANKAGPTKTDHRPKSDRVKADRRITGEVTMNRAAPIKQSPSKQAPVKQTAVKETAFAKETKRRLMGRRDALRSALAGDMSMFAQTEAAVGDEVDAAIATEQAEIRSQMASFESRELAQIEAALDKIKDGRYGRCESCDKPIGALRLKALPYATECINCARSGERGGADSGRHPPVNRIAAFRGEDETEPSDEAFEGIR